MKQIWLVDDDEEMLSALRLMLKLLDCETASFFNARSAVQAMLEGRRPDLMSLDIYMPEVTGLDLLEFMRRRADMNNLPVVMLSTESSDVMIDRARELGADAYVSKPVTLEELERAMKDAFDKRSRAG
jgi:CheY-like chemotaxis protein